MRYPHWKGAAAAALVTAFLIPHDAAAQRLLPGPEKNTRAAAPNGLGAKKVAVILFNYDTSPTQPVTPDRVRDTLVRDPDSVNAFYKEVSFGALELTGHLRSDGDVFGWYTIAESGGTDVNARVPELRQRAARDGYVTGNYDVTLFVHPFRNTGWGGQAFGRKEAWLDGWNPSVAVHEIFHLLGLDHANGLDCERGGRRVAIGDDWSSRGYGDPFDCQATAGFRHPNAYFKARMGWFMRHNLVDVPMDRRATRQYRIRPIERASSGLLCVRVPVPAGRIPFTYGWGAATTDVDLYYYLEFRRPIGFDRFGETDDVVQGVSIRLGTDIDTNHMTMLVDGTPATQTLDDAPLSVGEVFKDPVTGVTIRTLSADASGALVQVEVDAGQRDRQTPRLLWTRTDGTASLWDVDGRGNYAGASRQYGAYPDMDALDYFRKGADTARLLWARADGLLKLWHLDRHDNVRAVKTIGPFPTWTPRSYQRLDDGTARLLWSRTTGQANVWKLNANEDYAGHVQFGPYPDWTARSYRKLPDGTAKLLWTHATGQVSIWTLDQDDRYLRHRYFGPYTDWTATHLEPMGDGTSRLVWTRPDGTTNVWRLDRDDRYLDHVSHGRYVDWSGESFHGG